MVVALQCSVWPTALDTGGAVTPARVELIELDDIRLHRKGYSCSAAEGSCLLCGNGPPLAK